MRRKFCINDNKDFLKIYNKGKSIANRQFVIYNYNRVGLDVDFRLGLSISKKVGNAVVRNRLRRQIKSIFYENKFDVPNDKDYVIIVRRPANNLTFIELEKSIISLLQKIRKVKK